VGDLPRSLCARCGATTATPDADGWQRWLAPQLLMFATSLLEPDDPRLNALVCLDCDEAWRRIIEAEGAPTEIDNKLARQVRQ
jgi:hypothetical protein